MKILVIGGTGTVGSEVVKKLQQLNRDKFNGKTYSLVSSDVITGERAADLYSKYLGKSVTYTGDDLDGWAEQQNQFLPKRIVDDLRAMYNHFLENGYLATEADLAQTREILGQEPRSYKAFVKEVTAHW